VLSALPCLAFLSSHIEPQLAEIEGPPSAKLGGTGDLAAGRKGLDSTLWNTQDSGRLINGTSLRFSFHKIRSLA
jgi:hypothetical protein